MHITVKRNSYHMLLGCRKKLFLDYSLLVNSRDVDSESFGLWICMWVAGEKQTFWILDGTKIILTHVNKKNVLLPNEKQSQRNFPHIVWTYIWPAYIKTEWLSFEGLLLMYENVCLVTSWAITYTKFKYAKLKIS